MDIIFNSIDVIYTFYKRRDRHLILVFTRLKLYVYLRPIVDVYKRLKLGQKGLRTLNSMKLGFDEYMC